MRGNKHTLVLYYLNGCPPCNAFKPTFKQAMQELRSNSKLNVEMLESAEARGHAAQRGHEFSGYPHLVAYEHGTNAAHVYTGDRTLQSVLDFAASIGKLGGGGGGGGGAWLGVRRRVQTGRA